MKISRIKKLTVIFLITFAVLFAASFMAGRPDLRYRISEALRPADNRVLPTKTEIKDLDKYTLEVLKTDKRINFCNNLLLINEEYRLKEKYTPKLTAYKETKHKINEEIVGCFTDLVSAVKQNSGEELLIVSAYRSKAEQLQTIKQEGEKAAEVNASEHLTGLACDVCVRFYGGNAFLKSRAGRFVNSNCGNYGFIIRYPMLKSGITKIGYEPWHIRYVGLPHSKIIEKARLSLEEYIKGFKIGEFYKHENYIITRQKGEYFKLPKNFKSAEISCDNTGYYIITIEK